MIYGKAILGDNQFLGVNHSSQARASELFELYRNPDAILKVIGSAYDSGIRDFMFTTHDRYDPVFDEICRSNLFPGLHYTPCLPYAHKYWNQLSDKGPLALLASTVLKVNPVNIIPASLAFLLGKTRGVTQVLIEIETLKCKGLPLRGVFLQNLVFDFLMAMELYNVIDDFADIVTRRLNALPGFITMNHPAAVRTLCERVGLARPWICANFNISGFRMNPSRALCEASVASQRSNNIAMSVFSSRRADSIEAAEYVRSHLRNGNLKSILFGSSNPENILDNFKKFSE